MSRALPILPSDPPGQAGKIQCPSAHPAMPGSAAFGVVQGTVGRPFVAYLESSVAVTPELLALAEPVAPTEVFRFAAPCAGNACQHFDGQTCTLAQRIVEQLPAAVATLPACAIREGCRWYLQEGSAACFRCPLVATQSLGVAETGEALRIAAAPPGPATASPAG